MSTPDHRRPAQQPRNQDPAQGDRQARQRRAPLFELNDDDIAPTRRTMPAPLGDLVDDIHQALPTRVAPAAPPREQPQAPRPMPQQAAAARPPASPSRSEPAQRRPVATRERPVAPKRELRAAPVAELVEGETALLRQARTRFDDATADLVRVEQRVAARERPGYRGYLTPPPTLPSLGSWAWLGVVALLSVLILATLGGGDGTAFSRWSGLLPEGGATLENRVALFAANANPVGDYTLRAAPSLTPAAIDRILAAYGSPATGSGEIWYNLGLQYGIDPAFAVAFFVHESGAGTAQAWAGLKPDGSTTHNVGNIICAGYATCYGRFRDYPSWAEGIEDWYRLIDVEYLEGRGHKTVADIIPVYAPSFENDVNGYVNVVQRLVDEWRTQGAP